MAIEQNKKIYPDYYQKLDDGKGICWAFECICRKPDCDNCETMKSYNEWCKANYEAKNNVLYDGIW